MNSDIAIANVLWRRHWRRQRWRLLLWLGLFAALRRLRALWTGSG